MLKKIYFSADFKKLHCKTGMVEPDKLGPQAGHTGIFRPGGMNWVERVCDFDGRAGPRD
jgi:hypothetical protein